MKKYFMIKTDPKTKFSDFDLTLKNRFDVLAKQNDDMCTSAFQSEKDVKTNTSKEKVPPITIGYNYHDVLNELLKQNDLKYDIKFVSIGIKLNLHSLKDFYAICASLKEKGITFFTHQTSEHKQLKFVLKGLYLMDTSLLNSYLKEVNLVCEDIKTMNIKKKRFDSQVNYLVYFKKDATDLSKLQKIKAINNVIVKWEFFKHPRGPTQCRRCQLYGHGTNHCNLPPKCVKCSGNHFTKDCTTKVDDNNKDLLKCVNCSGNHSANYGGCPAKLKYIEMRTKAENKRRPKNSNDVKKVIPTNNDNNFPSLSTPRRNNSAWFNQFKRTPNPPTETVNFSSNELLSATELLAITKELISKLRLCKSALDQIEVITELAIKYGCKNV